MAGVNDFRPFAIGGLANVVSQADWLLLPALGTGFQAGIAQSAQLNKAWRQATTMAYVIGGVITELLPTQDVLDNGDPDAIIAQLIEAIQQAAIKKPDPLVVTASANFTLDLGVAIVGFNRTAAVAAQTVTLPNGLEPGNEIKFQDLVGNFNAFPVTLLPPAGSIAGLPNYVMNEGRQTAVITYYGGNLYGVQS